MTLIDIKRALIKMMQSIYPASKYRYYSKEVVERFVRPCFFTELTVDSAEPSSAGADQYQGTFSIEILQDVIDEAEAMRIYSDIRAAFGRYFMVDDSETGKSRAVKVRSYDFDFVGTDDNVPVIMVNLDWFDRVDRIEPADMIEDVDVSLTVQVEE